MECPNCQDVFPKLELLACNHRICSNCLEDYSKFDPEERICRICHFSIIPSEIDLLPGIDQSKIKETLDTIQKILQKVPDDPTLIKQETQLIHLLKHIEAYLENQSNYGYLLDRYQKTPLEVNSEYYLEKDQVIRGIDLEKCFIKDNSCAYFVFTQMYSDGTVCKNYDNKLMFKTGEEKTVCVSKIGNGEYQVPKNSSGVYVRFVKQGSSIYRQLKDLCGYSNDSDCCDSEYRQMSVCKPQKNQCTSNCSDSKSKQRSACKPQKNLHSSLFCDSDSD